MAFEDEHDYDDVAGLAFELQLIQAWRAHPDFPDAFSEFLPVGIEDFQVVIDMATSRVAYLQKARRARGYFTLGGNAPDAFPPPPEPFPQLAAVSLGYCGDQGFLPKYDLPVEEYFLFQLTTQWRSIPLVLEVALLEFGLIDQWGAVTEPELAAWVGNIFLASGDRPPVASRVEADRLRTVRLLHDCWLGKTDPEAEKERLWTLSITPPDQRR